MINTILTEIATNEKIKAHAFKCAKGSDLWQDCISDLIITLAELNKDKLIDLYNKGTIYLYCFKIIWLSFNSEKSPFYRKYIKRSLYIPMETETSFDYCETYVNERLDELEKDSIKYPTDIHLFRLYLKFGSFRKVEKETGIQAMTVCKIINKLKTKI